MQFLHLNFSFDQAWEFLMHYAVHDLLSRYVISITIPVNIVKTRWVKPSLLAALYQAEKKL